MQRKREITHQVPTNPVLKPSPEAAMLSQPSAETCPPHPLTTISSGAEPTSKGHCQK